MKAEIIITAIVWLMIGVELCHCAYRYARWLDSKPPCRRDDY